MSEKPKNVEAITSFIRARRKEAMDAGAPKDPDEKGNAGDGANRDEAATKPSMPKGDESNAAGKSDPKTVENKEVVKNGEPNDATSGVSKVNEPETVAKTASRNILSILHKAQGKKEASSEKKEATPDKKAGAESKKEEAPEKKATSAPEDIEFDETYFVKLAKVINADQSRIDTVRRWAEEDHGVEVANQIIKAASFTEEELLEAEKQAALQEQEFLALQEKLANLSDEEKAGLEKFAKIQRIHFTTLKTDLEKQAYELGAKHAAAMMDAGGEMPPEQAAPSEEEIIAMIEQMVASGEITEEEAAQILAELEAGSMEEMPEETKAAAEKITKVASTFYKKEDTAA